MRTPAATAAAMSSLPGSEMVGVPASDTSAMLSPASSRSTRAAVFLCSLCACKLVVDVAMAWRVSRCAVRRVSSAAISATSRNTRSARTVMSSRLPIGVATTKSVPVGKLQVSSLRSRVRNRCELPLADRPFESRQLCRRGLLMIASEPLPHFVDDLLGYLHETHPTHATLDGVHTHDDLLEDVSRHAIDSEAHALSGYLRRLDEINREALTTVERLEHRMLTAHLQARMFDLEAVRT